MPLTEEEIKSIGREAGGIMVVKAKCKERAGFVLELMTDVRDHQVEIMRAIVDPKARRSVINTISSQIDTIKETYPDSPTKSLLVDDLTAIKNRAEQNTSGGTMAFVEQTAQGYVGLHDKLSDILLEDFKQCECEPAGSVARKAKPPTADQVQIEVWEERDRLHIGIQDKNTGQYYASWWDDEAREMFENGFFKGSTIHGQLSQSADTELANSVLVYALEMGILSKG